MRGDHDRRPAGSLPGFGDKYTSTTVWRATRQAEREGLLTVPGPEAARSAEGQRSAVKVDERAAGRERVWLVQPTYEDAQAAAVEKALIDRYGSDTMVLREEFPHVTVELFRSADNPPGDSQDAS